MVLSFKMNASFPPSDVSDDLIGASDRQWLSRLEHLAENRGYFEPLGPNHSALLTDRGTTLIVTFETINAIRADSPLHQPIGWDIIREQNWSNLCLLAHRDTWFRDATVFGYFDRLIEDGFFEEFERVVFYGAGMCGYAAAAFSVVALDAQVVMVEPHSTLDPTRAAFDQRFPAARELCFTGRYGYAPDMVEMARQVTIFLDPASPENDAHAEAFQADHTQLIRCHDLGERLDQALWAMGVIQQVIETAALGNLSAQECYRALRTRRKYMPYLRRLLKAVEDKGRPALLKRLCEQVLRHHKAPRFQRALNRANIQLCKQTRGR